MRLSVGAAFVLGGLIGLLVLAGFTGYHFGFDNGKAEGYTQGGAVAQAKYEDLVKLTPVAPANVAKFADAFCTANVDAIASYVPAEELEGLVYFLISETASRGECDSMRYLDGIASADGSTTHSYKMGAGDAEMIYIFLFSPDGQLVGIQKFR